MNLTTLNRCRLFQCTLFGKELFGFVIYYSNLSFMHIDLRYIRTKATNRSGQRVSLNGPWNTEFGSNSKLSLTMCY
jgi:hypothetical protein